MKTLSLWLKNSIKDTTGFMWHADKSPNIYIDTAIAIAIGIAQFCAILFLFDVTN